MIILYGDEGRAAFRHWLRTGGMPEPCGDAIERKFNPYHDPEDGRFTFAPGGPQALSRVIISRGRFRAAADTAE